MPIRPFRLIAAGLVVAQSLAALSTDALAQSSRPRPNDAYKPADQGAGLGVLNSDGSAAPAPAYGTPTRSDSGVQAVPQSQPAVTRTPATAPSYVGGPPSYSGAPSYSATSSPPPYVPPYDGSQYRSAGGRPTAFGSNSGATAPAGDPAYGAQPYAQPAQGPSYGQSYGSQQAQGYPSSGYPSSGYPSPGRQQPAYGTQPYSGNDAYRPSTGNAGSFGEPYTPPSANSGYDQRPPYRSRERDHRADSTYSSDEIKGAGHTMFGSISQGLANAIEHTFRRQGRPNGYILGEEGGGAFIAGVRYGQGTLFTKDAGSFPVYWQGPSIGFDAGAAGSKVMILVYNLRDTNDVFDRFGGVDGSAYVVGGVGVTLLKKDHVTMAPIRSGVGLRLGANVGYLKFSHKPTWNPF